MKHILKFDEILFEYNLSNNLYKVRDSKEPIIGEPIFVKDDLQDFDKIQAKIDEDLKGYEAHMKEAIEKDKTWREAAKGQKGEKGNITWYDTAKKTRELAFKIVKDAAAFLKEFNKLYNDNKETLLGTNHVEIAKVIYKIAEIYPYSLINEAGKLKRMKKTKFDAKFIADTLLWTESIVNRYKLLDDAGKTLGKSESQILGMRKQAAAMRARWGSY